MAVCDNCGIDSNLMLAVKLNGESLWNYCSGYECMEEAKMRMGSIRDQVRGTHYEFAGKKEADSESENS